MSDNIYVKQLVLGKMRNCVYLIGCASQKKCVVIDPAWDIGTIVQTAAADGMEITAIIATHFHPDHVGGRVWGHNIAGVAELLETIDVPVYAHKLEIEGLCKVTGITNSAVKACASGDIIAVGDAKITTIHTPGHTPGSQCIALADNLVSGDTLFISGCGRVDLPGGDVDQMYDSLTQKIKKLPPHTTILPGHNYDKELTASLAHVLKVNPYLQIEDRQTFQSIRCPS